jgi:protein-tyrosine phosphatase
MIDIHTHILFDVDDGAHTLHDSIDLLKACEKIGINHVVLTPHISKYRPFKCSKVDIKSKYNLLKEKMKDENLNIDIYLGAEIDEDDHLIENIERGHTINQSRYVLIDFSMRHADISEVIYELKHFGYKVIVAHPERLYYLTFDDLFLIKKEGALFQVSSKHLIGLGDKRACKMAKHLLKEDLIDFVSSDAHDVKTILSMRKAFLCVSKKKGSSYANQLFVDNPYRILSIHTNDISEGL